MQQAQIILRFLFVAHEDFPEAVVPGMCALDLPSPGRVLATADAFRLLANLPNMRDIVASPHNCCGGLAAVTFVGAQMLATPATWFGPPNDNAVQGFRQQFDVMSVRPADDKRERDASPVHQQAALGAFFSPDPWGCCRPLPAPAALCLACRQCSAIPKRSLPNRRIRPSLPATSDGKIPPPATVETADARRSHCQSFLARPSTDNRCATHIQWRRIPHVVARVCARHPPAADIFDL